MARRIIVHAYFLFHVELVTRHKLIEATKKILQLQINQHKSDTVCRPNVTALSIHANAFGDIFDYKKVKLVVTVVEMVYTCIFFHFLEGIPTKPQ